MSDERIHETEARAALVNEGWTVFDVRPDWKRATRGGRCIAEMNWRLLLHRARAGEQSAQRRKEQARHKRLARELPLEIEAVA